jgi:hypothetical protein
VQNAHWVVSSDNNKSYLGPNGPGDFFVLKNLETNLEVLITISFSLRNLNLLTRHILKFFYSLRKNISRIQGMIYFYSYIISSTS